jgi:uncharacterized membrane protein (Fun14 family)
MDMAERRMFSIKIINSAKFLKMPAETQNLYFHLGLRADDDGIVEAFTVMRLIGATEDSLKLLHAKGYITVLNEDLVSYINDWNEHNKIRADRKIDSIYKDLLIQMLPDIKLLEPKQRADRKPKNIVNNMDGIGTSHGQPMVGIGQDRTGQVRTGQVSTTTEKNICIPFEEQKEPAITENTVVVVNDDELKSLIKKFKEKYGGSLNENLLKNLISTKSLDIVKKCIDEFEDFVTSAHEVEKVFYDFTRKYGTDKAYKKNTSYNNNKINKPIQATNYEQREYDDDYINSLYDNVTFVKEGG